MIFAKLMDDVNGVVSAMSVLDSRASTLSGGVDSLITDINSFLSTYAPLVTRINDAVAANPGVQIYADLKAKVTQLVTEVGTFKTKMLAVQAAFAS